MDYDIPKELLLIEAWMEALEQLPIAEEKGRTQYETWTTDLDYPAVHCFLDWVRLDGDGKESYAKEFKYSANPDGWGKFTLGNQLGTYFWAVGVNRIEAVIFKVPLLKIKKGKNEESGEEFKDRVKKEILLNKLEYITKQNYYKNEFSMDEVKRRYQVMTKELYDRLEKGEEAFWQTDNRKQCFDCQFLEICSNDGIVSEQLYKKKERKK